MRTSEHSKRAFKNDLKFYLRWCEENKKQPDDELSAREYLLFMKEKYSRNTINRKLSTLRNIYGFNIKSLKPEKKGIRALTDIEINTIRNFLLVESSSDGKFLKNPRNFVIFEIFLQTGIRSIELVRLKIEDINFTYNKIKIHGKGNKWRLVPLNSRLRKIILQYLEICKTIGSFLFNYPRTTRGIRKIFEKVSKKTGIKFSIHDLRRTFATRLRLDGNKIEVIQRILGHENITTTMRYIGFDEKEVINAVENISYNEGWKNNIPEKIINEINWNPEIMKLIEETIEKYNKGK